MADHDDLFTLNKWIWEGVRSMGVVGLTGAARSYFVAQLLGRLQKPSLIVLPSAREAENLSKELLFFGSRPDTQGLSKAASFFEFPPYDISPLTGLSPPRELVTRRLEALYSLLSNENPVVLTSIEAISYRVMPKEALLGAVDYLEVGEEVVREDLLQKLETSGYQRSSLAEERGDYSVRGGVIDVFPPWYPFPVRMEFWGDRLESIRPFDPLSQRSQGHLEDLVLLPANEIIMNPGSLRRARSMGRLPVHPEDALGFPGQEAWLNHFYPRLGTLFEYLPSDSLLIVFDPHRVEPTFGRMDRKFSDDVQKYRKEAAEKGIPFPETEGLILPSRLILGELEARQRLDFKELELGEPPGSQKTLYMDGPFHLTPDWDLRLSGRGRVSMAPLAEKISGWLASRTRVVLVSRTEQQANRLKEILENYEVRVDPVVPCWADIPKEPGLSICLGRLSKGFNWPDLGLHVITEDEIFGPKRTQSGPEGRAKDRPLAWSSFSQLKAGDFVVHEEHGIGRYGGLLKMEVENKAGDFVIIEYARKDRLYIPADRISILQKYVGVDEGNPKLDRLGGRSWDIAKKRARRSVERIAKQLIHLYALRKYRKGFAFSPPDYSYQEFEATFEHEETLDQTKAIQDVLEDMSSERPMDRLICGDVGFGKTEVAIRAAFKAVSDAKQVALLVPTTVLAEQHHETFTRRMSPFGMRVGLLSRFKTRAEQSRILAEVRSGHIDILIGTHRILQKDVKFRDLGLLIIDEEQRFGVKQKEALKRYRALVDVVAITATPIPRTFQLSLMGVRDLTTIETPPQDRLSIQTYLSPYDESLISRALRNELERGGQIFFVHNHVRDIDQISEQLQDLVPEARFAVAHGQMNERDLEDTMMRFLRREIDVLVCTTIIESGLDIPSANTIIINEVDHLGLAQIYQLRGRVGRSKEKAYAYLLVSNGSRLTRDAEKRLKALMDFSHLGAGLHLAMHDLKIRGGGNILGFSQSGDISAIGYELYLKLMERSISELKGEEWHEDINPEINVDLPAFVPEHYVMDTDVRLNLYRRLSNLREKEELETMAEEIQDRFGPPPKEVRNLLGVMSIRLLLKKVGITRLDVGQGGLVLTLSQSSHKDPERLVQLVSSKPFQFCFLSQYKLKVHMAPVNGSESLGQIEKAILDLPLS